MNHGHQFDNALSIERKAEQERKQKEREARKKLEAAAPDLLAACEKMISSFKKSSSVPISLNSAYETMKQAIAKAKQ